MATSNDHDKEGTGRRPDPAVDDLALPDAVAEQAAGGGWTPVTLKRGLTTDITLFEWRSQVINQTGSS